jgi:hypothetical protein
VLVQITTPEPAQETPGVVGATDETKAPPIAMNWIDQMVLLGTASVPTFWTVAV